MNRQLTVLRRWAWLLVASVALAAGAAYMVSRTIPPTYEAQAKVGVGEFLVLQNPDPNQIALARELVQFYVDKADRSVYQAAADSLGPPASADSVRAAVDVVPATDSAKILITAQDGEPSRAAQIANAVAKALVAVAPPDTKTKVDVLIEEQIASITGQIAKAQDELQRLEACRPRSRSAIADRPPHPAAERTPIEFDGPPYLAQAPDELAQVRPTSRGSNGSFLAARPLEHGAGRPHRSAHRRRHRLCR